MTSKRGTLRLSQLVDEICGSLDIVTPEIEKKMQTAVLIMQSLMRLSYIEENKRAQEKMMAPVIPEVETSSKESFCKFMEKMLREYNVRIAEFENNLRKLNMSQNELDYLNTIKDPRAMLYEIKRIYQRVKDTERHPASLPASSSEGVSLFKLFSGLVATFAVGGFLVAKPSDAAGNEAMMATGRELETQQQTTYEQTFPEFSSTAQVQEQKTPLTIHMHCPIREDAAIPLNKNGEPFVPKLNAVQNLPYILWRDAPSAVKDDLSGVATVAKYLMTRESVPKERRKMGTSLMPNYIPLSLQSVMEWEKDWVAAFDSDWVFTDTQRKRLKSKTNWIGREFRDTEIIREAWTGNYQNWEEQKRNQARFGIWTASQMYKSNFLIDVLTTLVRFDLIKPMSSVMEEEEEINRIWSIATEEWFQKIQSPTYRILEPFLCEIYGSASFQ